MTNNSMQPIGMGEGISSSESLPTHVAKQWGFPLQRVEREGTVFYSIRDWIAGITGASPEKARIIWKDFKRSHKDAGGAVLHALPYKASDGKPYETEFTNDEGLYKIAVTLYVSKNRPALRAIKDYLAKAGVFVDEARRDPEAASEKLAIARRNQAVRRGRDEEWVSTREAGVIPRKQFVARIYALVRNKEAFSPIIGSITNDVYRGTFQSDTRGLQERLGISSKQTPRDYMSRLALLYTAVAEETIKTYLGRYSDTDFVPVSVIHDVVHVIAEGIGAQADVTAKALQIDIVTGRKLDDKPLTQGEFVGLLSASAQPRGLRSGGQSKSQT